MVTVPEATKIIVERSRYLSEAMSKNLINLSSLARYIKPEIEQMLIKEVSESSLLMALKRLEGEIQPKYQPVTIFKSKPEITLKSNLSLFTIPNEEFKKIDSGDMFAVIQGLSETTFFVLNEKESDFSKLEPIAYANSLTAISIKLPKEAMLTPGIFYFFLKSLTWEGINVIEIISTSNEFTMFFEDKNIERAFSIIKSLFTNEELKISGQKQ